MPAPVDKLTSTQCAVRVGTPITALGRPSITVTQPGTGRVYKATIEFFFEPDVEFDPANPTAKLPAGSNYAVLNLATEYILRTDLNIECGFKTVTANDFTINISIDTTIPGFKGNHGS